MQNQREVPTEHGKKLARQLEIPFLEVSARTRVNIDEMFIAVIREIDLHERIRVARRNTATQGRHAPVTVQQQQEPDRPSKFMTLRRRLTVAVDKQREKCNIL